MVTRSITEPGAYSSGQPLQPSAGLEKKKRCTQYVSSTAWQKASAVEKANWLSVLGTQGLI